MYGVCHFFLDSPQTPRRGLAYKVRKRTLEEVWDSPVNYILQFTQLQKQYCYSFLQIYNETNKTHCTAMIIDFYV
jgi:hypothetical protein